MFANVLSHPSRAEAPCPEWEDIASHESEPARVILADSIERNIRNRTGGRVRRLRIEVADGRIVVRGSAASYHVKQLALQAVLDTAKPAGAWPVRLEIHVRSGARQPARARSA